MQVMRNVFSKSAMACLLTSNTTAIGIFSLYFINLKFIQSMGLLAGIGVLFAYILTIILLPILINMFPPRPSKRNTISLNKASRVVQSIILILERTNERYPKSILLCFSAVSIFLILGFSQIEIDTVFKDYFPIESGVRQTIELMDDQFIGSENMEILFESETEGTFKDPEVLQSLESIKETLETFYPQLVTHNLTLNNQVKLTHQKLNQNQTDAYSFPNQADMLAQLLVLIE